MASIVVEQTFPYRQVSSVLVTLDQGSKDVQSTGVRFITIALIHRLTNHLCEVVGLGSIFRSLRPRDGRVHIGRLELLLGNEAQVPHSTQNILLTLPRPLRIRDRVIPRRCLGQTRQHRRFRER